MRWIEKIFPTFFNYLDEFYHRAKLWEDRTTYAGCRCENMGLYVFVCHAHGALFFRGWHNLKRYCVTIYESILMQFTWFFSDGIAVLTALESSHIVDRWRHNFSQDCSQKM